MITALWGSTRTLCLPNRGESERWVLPVGHQHLNQLVLVSFTVRPWHSCHFTALVLVSVVPTGVNVPSEKSKRTSLPAIPTSSSQTMAKFKPSARGQLSMRGHLREWQLPVATYEDCWSLPLSISSLVVVHFGSIQNGHHHLGMMAGTARCGMCLTCSMAVLLCRWREESQQFCM